jgi:peptidoglycan/LPS O-acetylase OafA/YrhL
MMIDTTIRDATASDRGVAKQATRRPHLYELDMLRVVTAFGVVAVHVIAFTVIYNTSRLGAIIQHGVEATMHFTREVFLFTTALVLVYTYIGKRFDLKTFARKRGVGVVVPYVLWSMIYLLIAPHPSAAPQLLGLTAHDLITGDAAVQLYYILLTIQFYLLFPVLLALLPLLDRHRWLVLGVSAALEVVILALDYHVVTLAPAAATPLGAWFDQYQDRLLPIYQFYFVLGAICALHLDRLRAFALRHGRLIGAATGVTLLAYWGRYAYVVGVERSGVDRAIAVLQPIMVPYSLAVIAFLWWIACRWANGGARRTLGDGGGAPPRERPAGSRVWRTLADASFGIYLTHPLFITFAMDHMMPHVPSIAPEPLRVALVWAIAVAGSSALSIALMRIPILSRLVGRDTPLPPALAWRAQRAALMGRARQAAPLQRVRALYAGLRTWASAGQWAIRERMAERRRERGYAALSRIRSTPASRTAGGAPVVEGPSQRPRPLRVEQPLHGDPGTSAGREPAARGSR